MHDVCAIIPAAGRHFVRQFGGDRATHPAALPVAGKPFLYWVIEPILKAGIRRVLIVVNENDDTISRLAQVLFGRRLDLEIVTPDKDCGVGYSVLTAAKKLKKNSPVLVVLGDTYFQLPDEGPDRNHSWVLVKDVEDQARWCMAKSAAGNLIELFDKPSEAVDSNKALIGAYYFANGLVSSELDYYKDSSEQSGLEMSEILKAHLQHETIKTYDAEVWLDSGNSDHLYEAQDILLRARAFNKLETNHLKGTIKKSSSSELTLLDEINYYNSLPNQLKAYFPQIVSCSTRPGDTWLEAVYHPYPTLADLYLFSDLPDLFWINALKRLRAIVNEFLSFDYGISASGFDSIYIEKNFRRLEQYRENKNNPFHSLFDESNLSVNGRPVPSISKVFELCRAKLEDLSSNARLSAIHGDLCFSNILCHPDRLLIKLIDPRGNFGARGTIGDFRYDIAKLSQSIFGLYDFILNDLVHFTYDGAGHVSLDYPEMHSTQLVQNHFSEMFLQDRFDKEVIRFIEAWLLLSLLPLHSEAPKRQAMLACRGLEILAELKV
jgi:dTDP-glucose pyrophosphorylase